MHDPLDSYLTGRADRGALTPEEGARADALERVIEDTGAFLAARPAPDLTAAVMRRVEDAGQPATPGAGRPLERWLNRVWAPRDVAFRVRPAYGLAAGAAMALAIAFSPIARPPAADEPRFFVQFRLEASNASTVRLAGTFTNWQPRYELHETAPGIWTITLPLALGVHDYGFVVDGEHWVSDPLAQRVDDGFGGTNSRIALLAPDGPRS